MTRRFFSDKGGMKKSLCYIGIAFMTFLLIILFTTVRFDIKGHFDGLFLLKGSNDWWYELKDDLYVGDGDRVLYSIDFDDPRYRISSSLHSHKPGEPYLYYEWDAKDGSGFIRNFLPNGEQILTCFGRFVGDDKKNVHGLFVGGGLPSSVTGGDNVFMDETGMAYFDRRRWYHVWCNVNEGIISPLDHKPYPPSRWRFLGSKVLDESDKSLVISSSHELTLDGAPLHIDRYVYLNAGDTYFVLTIKITNIGAVPARYIYVYGDEPWVGNYGSSAGDVGWVKDGVVNREAEVDTGKYTFAGMFDYGNSEIGEGHGFSGTANFIEWLGAERPMVYFANHEGAHTPGAPLASEERLIGLQWGARPLNPGEERTYLMAIGMAGHDPQTGFPVKPEIRMAFNDN